MGIRDEEIKRLIFYAKGMGVKVTIYNKSAKNMAAEWSLDGTTIVVYKSPGKTKTDVILDLLHELGHHVWFVHEKERQPDLKFEEAIERENLVEEDPSEKTPTHLRKKIYDVEKAGTDWWMTIYKDTNLKIPLWKVHAAIEFDTWMYEQYWLEGAFPKGKAKRKRRLEILAKHKGIQYE